MTMAKAVLMALLPLICCMVNCGLQGKTLGQVYLPASLWNDELFYYKQVEGIVHYGFPQGYFGFNESHALKLSFAAWSPVLVFPWVLWGWIFGWNLLSPIACNICLTMLSCFLFVWLVKPTWRQTVILAMLFCLYTPYARYMLSGMPEALCFNLLILFYGLAINYLNREKTWKLVLLFLLSSIMTLMRPYLVLFLFLPIFLWIRKSRWKGVLGSSAVFLVTMGLYACIKHYLGAEYFAPLFFTDWIEAFFEKGLFGGIRFTAGKLYYMGIDFWQRTIEGFRSGLASGAFFGAYLITLGILLFQSLRDFIQLRRSRRQSDPETGIKSEESEEVTRKLIIEVHLAFCFIAMFFALLLMYKLTEGSKHLLTFIAAGFFIIALMDTKFYKKAVLLGLTFAYLFSYKAVNPYDYKVIYTDEERMKDIQIWDQVLSEQLQLSADNPPSYENVVIWVFNDLVDGNLRNSDWQFLYGLPSGFGISCCMPEYILENLENLQSRYLFSPSNGLIDAACAELGYQEIWRDENEVLYLLEKTPKPR